MVRKLCSIMFVLSAMTAFGLFYPTWTNAKEVGDVNLPDTLPAGSTQLLFNGGGVREKFFIDLYSAGLYLKKKMKSGRLIIQADEEMAILLHITSGRINSENMETATREGFDNSTGGNTGPIQTEIKNFIKVFKKKIKEGDIFTFVYLPGTGTQIYKNDQLQTTIQGLPFKKALFGIWLNKKAPADEDLMEELLGNN